MQVLPLYAFAILLDLLKWSNMRSRSSFGKSTGSSSTTEKELIVYHMRSQQGREEAMMHVVY
jgi:hypothetical protein